MSPGDDGRGGGSDDRRPSGSAPCASAVDSEPARFFRRGGAAFKLKDDCIRKEDDVEALDESAAVAFSDGEDLRGGIEERRSAGADLRGGGDFPTR